VWPVHYLESLDMVLAASALTPLTAGFSCPKRYTGDVPLPVSVNRWGGHHA
jgi:hypothetical protein